MKLENRYGLDWLSLSWPKCPKRYRASAEIVEAFGSTGTPCPGAHGYSGYDLAIYGSLLIRKDDLLITLPGQALASLRQTVTDKEICLFFTRHGPWRASRLDLAIDCYDEDVTPQLCHLHWLAGHVTSRAEVARLYNPALPKGQHTAPGGFTWYAGRPASTRYCRVYDKAAECVAKGIVPPQRHISRFELQHRGDAAAKAFQLFAEQGPALIPKLFAQWIQFRDPDRSEIKKCSVSPWWLQIVGTEKVALKLDPRITTPEQTLAWLSSDQIAPSMSLARRFHVESKIETAIATAKPSPKKTAEWKSVFHPHTIIQTSALSAIKGRISHDDQNQRTLAEQNQRRKAILAGNPQPGR